MTRDQKITENLALVYSLARRFVGRGMEYDDIASAGMLGLIKAVDGFDESRGFKFSTYAVPVILGEMRRLFREGGAVKVSRTLKELSVRAAKEKENFVKTNAREPAISELAVLLDVSPEQLSEALTVCAAPLSLTTGEDDENAEIDIAEDGGQDGVIENLALKQVIEKLTKEEQIFIALRFFGGKTQSQTAKELGLNQVAVCRQEKKLLIKLRQLLI
jgi:RNA polymerase sigma factor, sigma-70 family